MKKAIKFLTAALALSVPLAVAPIANAETVSVGGGTDRVFFEDADDFTLYSQFDDQTMFTLQNRLYAPVLAESKAIYKYGTYGDAEISVDVTAINKSGNIDGGIYVQASNASNAHDGITAWNVNVEHAVNANTFALKLHRFENNRWVGAQKEVYNIKYTSDTVHLRVVVKSGILNAFISGDEPVFTHYIGAATGKVGLRGYYSPIYFENFSVTAPTIALEPNKLGAKIAAMENFDYTVYTDATSAALRAAVEHGKETLNSLSQADIDGAYADILAAENALIRIRTAEELRALTEKASAIIAEREKYTENSVGSLEIVLRQIEQADGENISELYAVLFRRIQSAVKYGGGNE